jgi:hypothetical protein
MIGRRQRFVHCFLLGGVSYGEADLLVLSWWCQCCYFKFSIFVAGLLFFYISFSFFWLCASFIPLGHDVVAEAGCNWYLHDINKCSLSKKNQALVDWAEL